jgi:hypothetical protein
MGHRVAAAPTPATDAVAMKRKSRRVGSGLGCTSAEIVWDGAIFARLALPPTAREAAGRVLEGE